VDENAPWIVSTSVGYLLMYVPLMVAVSMVIGSTRHEKRQLIVEQSLRTAAWVTTFMLVVYAVLQIVSYLV
jgi:hypothetical protein